MATLEELKSGAKDAIEGLGLSIGGAELVVKTRDLLVVEDGLDVLPLVLVAGRGPLSSVPFDSEGGMRREYHVWIALVSAWNGDAVKDAADVDAARAAIMQAFDGPDHPTLPDSVLMVRHSAPSTAEEEGWRANLKCVPLVLAVSTVERTG